MANTNQLKYLEIYFSKNTTKVEYWAIKSFLSTIYDDGEVEELATRYIQEKRCLRSDIQTFFTKIKHRPSTSIRTLVSNVRTFLLENDIELPDKFWKHLSRRVKGNGAQTDDRIPTLEELKQILIQMPQHGTAYYLTLLSSGMRSGELVQIKLSDIKLDEYPVRIKISGEYTKNGNRRKIFITSEAKQYVEEWLKVRDSFIQSAVRRSRYPKDTEDDRLFPFTQANILSVWHRALQKMGALNACNSLEVLLSADTYWLSGFSLFFFFCRLSTCIYFI